jgi:ribosomal protein S18 acetylase RimI-like enzyme
VFEVRASDTGALVGFAWLAIERRHGSTTGFIYDLEIKPEHRRLGHASRALSALETFAANEGAASVGLHVFAFNSGARALYSRCGYEVVSLNMRKALRRGAIGYAPGAPTRGIG